MSFPQYVLPKSFANYTQLDVDYCCHPMVKLQVLAQEAIALNPDLIFRQPQDLPWHLVEIKLAMIVEARTTQREEADGTAARRLQQHDRYQQRKLEQFRAKLSFQPEQNNDS